MNKYEYAKIVSDLLFANENNVEQKAVDIYRMKHELTPHGFEMYIQSYFHNEYGYNSKLRNGTYEFDWGIDIEGISKYWEKLIVQCKRRLTNDITEDDIRSFIWALYINNKTDLENKNVNIYYITTSKFTEKAKICAKKANIHLISYKWIYKIQKRYSIDQFHIDMLSENDYYREKCFVPDQSEIFYDHKYVVEDQTVMQFLKQIRRELYNKNNCRAYEIAKDPTLKLIAEKRPHNLESLLLQIRDNTEKEKIEKYWEEFFKRLKYVY